MGDSQSAWWLCLPLSLINTIWERGRKQAEASRSPLTSSFYPFFFCLSLAALATFTRGFHPCWPSTRHHAAGDAPTLRPGNFYVASCRATNTPASTSITPAALPRCHALVQQHGGGDAWPSPAAPAGSPTPPPSGVWPARRRSGSGRRRARSAPAPPAPASRAPSAGEAASPEISARGSSAKPVASPLRAMITTVGKRPRRFLTESR